MLLVGNNDASGIFSGVLSNTSGQLNFAKIGAGTQVLTGTSTYTGTTTIGGAGITPLTGGTLELSGASGRLTSAAANTIGVGGTLRLLNTSAANNTDRIGSGALLMSSGTLEFRNDGSAANYSESLGALTIASGASTIRADQAAVGNTSTLTLASLARTPGATVNFVGTGLGADARNRIVFTTAPTLDDGIMGGWATVNSADFATYAAGSVTALATYDTGPETGWTTASNVKLTSGTTTLTASRNINSLNFAQTADTTLDVVAGQTLRVETGGILVSGAFNGSIVNGTLTAGTGVNTAGELVVHQYSPNDFTIASTIANNGTGVVSLTTTGTGTTILSGVSTYTGATTINGGTLRLTGAGALPASTALTLNAGTFDLNGLTRSIGSLAGAAGSLVALGSGSLTVGANNTATTYAGSISGAGSLTKTGTAALVLLGASSYAGGTSVNQGVLAAQDPAALGSGPAIVNGGELALAVFPFSNALTLNAGGTLSARTYIPPIATPPPGAPASYTTTITGPVSIAGNATIALRDYAATTTAAVINLMSNLTGSGNLTISGPSATNTGTLILAGNNTGYSGNFTVGNLAVLELLGPQAKGTGSVTLNSGGTVRTSVDPGPASLGPDGVTSWYYNFGSSAGNTNRFASDLLVSPARVFSRTDPNINIPWNAGTSPYGTSPGAGYPFVPMPNWSRQGINIGVLSRGIFNVTTPGDYTFYAGSDDPGFLYIDGLLVASSSVNEVATAPITLAAGWHSIVMRMTQGGGSGGMTAYYSGPDTSGNKILVGGIPGTLKTGSLTPFDLGPLAITGGVGTVDMAVDTNVSTLSLASGSTLAATSPGLYTLTVNGPTTLAGNVNINAFTGDIVFNDPIGPASAYNVTLGGGYLVTFNAPNLYTGTTSVNSGELRLNATGGNAIAGNLVINAANNEGPVSNVRLLQSNQIPDTATVTMSGGILDLGVNNDTIATLGGNPTNWRGTRVIGTGTLTATSVTLTQGEIAAALSTAGGITKSTATAGPLILSGNNTYTGTTNVTAGAVNIRHDNALGATGLGNDTTVASGAQLQLQGGISTPEQITIAGAGIQNPYLTAVSGTGALRNVGGINTLAGPVTLGSAATIQSDTGNLTLANLNAATNALTLQGAGDITFSAAPSNLGSVTKSDTGAVIFGYDVGPAGSMPPASWT